MFNYSTNVKSRTTYEIGVSFGKPDYTKVVKHATATFHNFEIDEVLIRTGERIISIYDKESLFLKEYRRYSKSGDLVEKARDIEFTQVTQQIESFRIDKLVIEIEGFFFKRIQQYPYGHFDKTKNEFHF